MTPEETFRARLREARELRQYSQAKLGQLASLPPSHISHFETGERRPSFHNLIRLADALEVSTDYLLGRVDKPTGSSFPSELLGNYEALEGDDRRVIEMVVRQLAWKNQRMRKQG
jgi:transcriptional regulator with XRE-family HTH domain